MTKINKKHILPTALITAFLIIGIYGTNQVLADDDVTYPFIVQRIASKFGLKESEVSEVFEEERAEMWERKKRMLDDRLEQAVKDGKITGEQKNKIIEKRDEVQADRVAEMEQKKEEWQKWMKDNDIDPTVLSPYFGFDGFGRKGFHHMKMMN